MEGERRKEKNIAGEEWKEKVEKRDQEGKW
jgi:hypothetical protein